MPLTESSRNLLHYMQGCVDITTDIFLFNLPRNGLLEHENYWILEIINDGEAITGKYTTENICFTVPNVILVFSNDYPATAEFTEDRWLILKINNETELEDVTATNLKKKKRKQLLPSSMVVSGINVINIMHI